MPVPGMAFYALSKSALQDWHAGSRARSRAARHHDQHRAARPDRYGREPGGRADEGSDATASWPSNATGAPKRSAGMVAWLAGPEAGFVTGAMPRSTARSAPR